MKPMKKMLAWGLLGALPLMASMCGGGTEAPQPPPCPTNPPAPVRQDGELVRFEYGITDLEGRPKNCFRQGEGFRLYLYVINKTESLVHCKIGDYDYPTLASTTVPEKKFNQQMVLCRVGGYHIGAQDTMIFEVPLTHFAAKVAQNQAPYEGYFTRRSYCGAKWGEKWLMPLPIDKYLAKFSTTNSFAVIEAINPLDNSYTVGPYFPLSFQAEIPFTIQ